MRVIEAPVTLAVFPAADGAVNFARDELLMERARDTGRHLVRAYGWSVPTVSFGRNERVSGRYSAARIAANGYGAARRPTGGRALFHHRELTYAIAGQAPPGDTLRATYDEVHRVLAETVRWLGAEVQVAARTASARLAAGAPCFAEPSPGELIAGGRKLVASAQWRTGSAYLQHGSILIDDDQPLLAGLLEDGCESVAAPPPATLRELLGVAPTMAQFADALAAAITACTGRPPECVDPRALIDDDEASVRAAHYRDPAWTWRR